MAEASDLRIQRLETKLAHERELLDRLQQNQSALYERLGFISNPADRNDCQRQIESLEKEIDAALEQYEATERELEAAQSFQIDADWFKNYADKYKSRYGLLKLLGMPQTVELEEVYTKVCFLDDLSIRRFESIEAMEEAYRESGQRQFQVGRERSKLDGIAVANEHQYLMVLGSPPSCDG